MRRLDPQAAGKSARKAVGGGAATCRAPRCGILSEVADGDAIASSMTPMSALSSGSRECPCQSTESTRLTFGLTSSCGTTREPLHVCRRRAVSFLGSSIENF